jgi:hypothetical protein
VKRKQNNLFAYPLNSQAGIAKESNDFGFGLIAKKIKKPVPHGRTGFLMYLKISEQP